MSRPTQTAEDFAAKLIVATTFGSVFPDHGPGSIWEEARRLTGYSGGG